MVNNSTNINKAKESLNSDVNNSSNINKTKESLNSDGQQFHKYQQNKRKVKQVLLILVELSTITVSTFFCFVEIGGIVDYHCLNFLLLS
jgi:hypothetical protein